jgi:chaperonin GroES
VFALEERGRRGLIGVKTSSPERAMIARMKIRPLHDRIVVKPLEELARTAAGLVIPDTAAQKPVRGEVLAAGRGKRSKDGSLRPLDVKPGDKVLFGEYAGQRVRIHGEEILVLREDDVMGICED